MRAFHAEGRTADALTEYTKARNTLIGELGVEPGPQLLAAHQHVLAGHAIEVQPHPVPCQLPPIVAAVSGREQNLHELDHLTTSVATHARTSGTIVAISGTAGVGKTTLAVHWAQQVAHRFTDGQLYINLRGYDPREHRSALTKSFAVSWLLWGLPSSQFPTTWKPKRVSIAASLPAAEC